MIVAYQPDVVLAVSRLRIRNLSLSWSLLLSIQMFQIASSIVFDYEAIKSFASISKKTGDIYTMCYPSTRPKHSGKFTFIFGNNVIFLITEAAFFGAIMDCFSSLKKLLSFLSLKEFTYLACRVSLVIYLFSSLSYS